MKSETEIKNYIAECEKQTIKEKQMEHKYLEIVGETIISTLKWVLGGKNE